MVHGTVNYGQCCLVEKYVEKYLTSGKTQKDLLFLFVGLYMGRTAHLKQAALVGGNNCDDVEN